MHQIWKLRTSNQPSGRPFPWFGSTKPLYGNCLQQKCDHPDDKAPLSGRSSKIGKNFSDILGKLIAQLSVLTVLDYRPDGAYVLSSQTLI
jgi:hypothetical protein